MKKQKRKRKRRWWGTRRWLRMRGSNGKKILKRKSSFFLQNISLLILRKFCAFVGYRQLANRPKKNGQN